MHFLRGSLRDLAGALLTEPDLLDQVAGAAGIPLAGPPVDNPKSFAQDLCESREARSCGLWEGREP